MMYFPELKIVDRVKSDDSRIEVKELLVVELDWTKIDLRKKDSRIGWYKSYGITGATEEQKMALEQMLSEVDWSEFLYPQKYKYLFDKYSKFKISQSYYDECLHIQKMAIDEWNRQRPFDTNVREELLSPAITFIQSFFYLIGDAIYIYNHDLRTGNSDESYYEHSVLLRSLMLFRFWKFQTGGGLLLDKSTEFIKRYVDSIRNRFALENKQDLIDNVKFNPFGLSEYYPEKEEQLLQLVNQRIRDNKLNGILNYK